MASKPPNTTKNRDEVGDNKSEAAVASGSQTGGDDNPPVLTKNRGIDWKPSESVSKRDDERPGSGVCLEIWTLLRGYAGTDFDNPAFQKTWKKNVDRVYKYACKKEKGWFTREWTAYTALKFICYKWSKFGTVAPDVGNF